MHGAFSNSRSSEFTGPKRPESCTSRRKAAPSRPARARRAIGRSRLCRNASGTKVPAWRENSGEHALISRRKCHWSSVRIVGPTLRAAAQNRARPSLKPQSGPKKRRRTRVRRQRKYTPWKPTVPDLSAVSALPGERPSRAQESADRLAHIQNPSDRPAACKPDSLPGSTKLVAVPGTVGTNSTRPLLRVPHAGGIQI